MQKRIIRRGLVFTFIIILISVNFLSIVVSNDRVIRDIIYVPDDYPTIQEAVDSANNWDTIIVRDGTYIENININKQLTIKSENGYAVTKVEALDSHESVFEIEVADVTINGFSISGVTYYYQRAGIYISYGVRDINITHNYISDNVYGVYLQYGPSYSNIMDNIFVNNSEAVRIEYGNYNTIRDNLFLNNTQTDIQLQEDSTYNCVENNTSFGSRSGYCAGWGSTDNIFSNNTVSTQVTAIQIYEDSNRCQIIGNNLSSTSFHILILSNVDSNIVHNNTAITYHNSVLSGRDNTGIILYSSNYNNITNNTGILRIIPMVFFYVGTGGTPHFLITE